MRVDGSNRVWLRFVFALTATLTVAPDAAAQLPSASARALGMGENYTAAARGYAAIAWNPALLALADAPRRSLALLPVRGVAGLTPIGLNDISDWQGRSVPTSVREQWLRAIEGNGGQEGSAGGDATYVAAQFGRFGLQASTALRAVGDLTPGAAELLFFGNAGRTGAARQLDVGGSEIRAHAASTIAMSYALALPAQMMRDASVGVTVKYTIGHMLLLGDASGSTAVENAGINVQFPIVETRGGQLNARAGSGLGLDVGFAKRARNLTVGATIQNSFNTFVWDESKLEYREGLAQFERETKTSDFDARTLENAPADLKRAVHNARFARGVAAGVAWVASDRLTFTGDARVRLGHSKLAESTGSHIGAGAEYQLYERVAVRAGAAGIEHGYQVSGGVGAKVGPLNVAASVMRRNTSIGSGTVTMISFFSTIFE